MYMSLFGDSPRSSTSGVMLHILDISPLQLSLLYHYIRLLTYGFSIINCYYPYYYYHYCHYHYVLT